MYRYAWRIQCDASLPHLTFQHFQFPFIAFITLNRFFSIRSFSLLPFPMKRSKLIRLCPFRNVFHFASLKAALSIALNTLCVKLSPNAHFYSTFLSFNFTIIIFSKVPSLSILPIAEMRLPNSKM